MAAWEAWVVQLDLFRAAWRGDKTDDMRKD